MLINAVLKTRINLRHDSNLCSYHALYCDVAAGCKGFAAYAIFESLNSG